MSSNKYYDSAVWIGDGNGVTVLLYSESTTAWITRRLPDIAYREHHARPGIGRVNLDFLRAIERNTTPVCDGREGRRSIALVEAIYRAARNGGAVPVSLDKPRT